MAVQAGQQDARQDSEWLCTVPAFYAEFEPLRQHSVVVDHLYLLKDCGLLTADRRAFASPFSEVAFIFRRSAEGSGHVPKMVVAPPSFGHRQRKHAFHGWAFGIRSKPSPHWPGATERTSFVNCQARLEQAIRREPPCSDILKILDLLLDDLTTQSAACPDDAYRFIDGSQSKVAALASLRGQTARTLQRRMRNFTGLPPKRFLAVERFRRAVHEVPVNEDKLSSLASHLGFCDQAHLTREFQRHAGLSPGVFKRAYGGARGQVVRFVQDAGSPSRLKLAVWMPEDEG